MGKLFLVPTPVGNMADMTFRAVEVLKSVSLILAEDTRTSAKLLSHYGISTPCKSYHQYNEHKVLSDFVRLLQEGGDMAVITDAGTPGISDPGFLLVRGCLQAGLEVECLPGATALIPAVVQSGFPCERFIFEGFLPHQKGRKARIEALALQDKTMVIYESPHRLVKTLEQLAQALGGEREACVCREISKLYAESRRDTLAALGAHYTANPPKGEIVLVVAPRELPSYTYAYPRPALTVDVLWETILPDGERYILLVKRRHAPFADCYALPGGFVNEDETLEWAAGRELKEETGLWFKDYVPAFRPFRPYSRPDRDPRGRTVSMVYAVSVRLESLPNVSGGDDAAEAVWFPLPDLPPLAFDHAEICRDYLTAAAQD